MMNHILFKNIKIFYSEYGKGNVVVLLHGFLENQTMWQDFLADFSKKNRVITIDLLGHGDTECLGYIHSMEDNALVVQAVLSHLKIRKAILVGHSMGGYVALAFAQLFPKKVKGLVLLNSTSKADSNERKKSRDRAIQAVKKDYNLFIRLSIANLFNTSNQKLLFKEIDKVKEEALKTPLQGIVASLEGMKIRSDLEILLHSTPYPKMLILGKKDPVLLYDVSKEQIKDTKVILVTLADGHMSHIENRVELKIVLSQFFKLVSNRFVTKYEFKF